MSAQLQICSAEHYLCCLEFSQFVRDRDVRATDLWTDTDALDDWLETKRTFWSSLARSGELVVCAGTILQISLPIAR